MDKMEELRRVIADRLVKIEQLCHERGLAAMSRFTFIGRDPQNDRIVVMVTNEPNDDNVQKAVAAALRAEKIASAEAQG